MCADPQPHLAAEGALVLCWGAGCGGVCGPRAPAKWSAVGTGVERRASAWERCSVGKREVCPPGMVRARPTDTSAHVTPLVTVPRSARPSGPDWGPHTPWRPWPPLGWNPRRRMGGQPQRHLPHSCLLRVFCGVDTTEKSNNLVFFKGDLFHSPVPLSGPDDLPYPRTHPAWGGQRLNLPVHSERKLVCVSHSELV